MGVRRALAAATLLLLSAVPHADAAWPFVGARVSGAVTARFTVTKPIRIAQEVVADADAPWFGYVISRGTEFAYSIGTPRRADDITGQSPSFGQRYGFEAYVLPPGTYDLTLFSAERRTVRLRIERLVGRLTFRPVPMPVVATEDASPAPAWRTQVDVNLPRPARGLVTVLRENWVGSEQRAHGACVWHTTACDELDPGRVVVSGNAFPTTGRRDVFVHLESGRTIPAGAAHVRLASVVAGVPTLRRVFVLVVP
ncbi:MAG TPA: hypothetical protein VNA14_11780 [Mycobacteriales bacterium]|nr:hypothetical protein [Mycobacteriales bacterium]